MFTIDRDTHAILHTRGDTGDITLEITVNGSPVNFTAMFSLKKTFESKSYLLQKELIEGHLRLKHEDTQHLPFGHYRYDIEAHWDDGTEEGGVVTVGPYEYRLQPDVTV